MEDINLNIAIDYSNDPFYTETWFLVVIAGLLLFLLLLLVRSGKKSRRKMKAEKLLKETIKEGEEYQKETAVETEELEISEIFVQ
ncbi:MAG: hypothetical protein GXZ19_04100 [Bacteroidales bacterium]|nr:hypothetical protein [Bacteroidales bacterium]